MKRTKQDVCSVHGETTFFAQIRSTRNGISAKWECVLCRESIRQARREAAEQRKLKSVPKTCEICGLTLYRAVFIYENTTCCRKCYLDKKANEQRSQKHERRDQLKKDLAEKRATILHCSYGVCEHLALHHETLKDDPERLSTDFMLGLICGNEAKTRYQKNKMEINHASS